MLIIVFIDNSYFVHTIRLFVIDRVRFISINIRLNDLHYTGKMTTNNTHIIFGPQEKFKVWFDSLGTFLYMCLKERNASEILMIDAVSKQTLTCGKALERSTKLCRALKAMSLNKGETVCIMSENKFDYLIPVLATLFSGAVVYLLNFAYTPNEIKHAFGISKPKYIFCSLSTLPNLLKLKENDMFDSIIITTDATCDNDVEILNMESLIETEIMSDNFEIASVDSQDIALLCLSSGTTGLPKCVQLSHQNLIPTINGLVDERYINMTKNDVTVSILPFFHIYGFVLYLSTIVTSTKVIVMKSFKPDLYLQSIQEFKSTKLFVVPPILKFLVKNAVVHKFDISSVKDIIVGAAPLGKDFYQEAMDRFPNILIKQIYGATELGGLCTVQNCTDKYETVGLLLPNLQCKVLDLSSNKPVGPLQSGELCIKGISSMRGYKNNELETKNSFDSDGFYKTGDVGYYDETGNFFIKDRIKELIKYKGFQVAPAELEDLLLTHPAVKDCGVIGIPDDKAGQVPLAFILREVGVEVTEEELIQFVSDNISIQKRLYGGVRFINEIPRTASGKILRRSLKNLY